MVGERNEIISVQNIVGFITIMLFSIVFGIGVDGTWVYVSSVNSEYLYLWLKEAW